MLIRPFEYSEMATVIDLWQRCGLTKPWNDPQLDIERKLQVQPDMFFVGEVDGEIVSAAMAGYEGHRGWVNYLAVDPDKQGNGYGQQMMQHIEKKLIARGCPKINLQIRTSNTQVIQFYEALGYKPDNVVSMGKRLIADE